MHEELCPFCGTLREMDLTSYRTISLDNKGNEGGFTTIVYHCRHCEFFIRSEDIHEETVEAV